MNYKGYCLWADDFPTAEAPHYIVIVSEANPDGFALVVAISSVKYKDDGTEKYYDDACILLPEDLLDEQGKPILSKKSFVRYQYAQEISVEKLLSSKIEGKYRYKCQLSEGVLTRIQDGAMQSLELAPRYKKFFDLF